MSFTSFAWGHEDETLTLDSGAGLQIAIKTDKATSSLRGPGDIVSMRYEGVEYQDPRKGSHVNSGFRGLYPDQEGVSINSERVGDVQCVTVHAGELIHYYMMRRGENTLYMGTYFTRMPRPNLVRFIARIPYKRLPHGIVQGDVHDASCCVEAHDIFLKPDGQTRSKHYSNERLIDWQYFGARGPGVGIWFERDNAEGGSGGPFYRSLRDQGTSDQELTYVINYGEAQTEPYRLGILNRYALIFNHGQAPQPLETSWQDSLHLYGSVPREQRGILEGHAPLDVNKRQHYVVGLSGEHGQYWTRPDPLTGRFLLDGVREGTYRVELYRNELVVAQTSVTIKPGTRQHLALPRPTPWYDRDVFWRIGTWDGTPLEFRNGAQLTRMHPSDVRMAPWKISTFYQQAQMPWSFPACQWQDVNNDLVIQFPMEKLPTRDPVVRIGITDAFAHARPGITVNGWQAPLQSPSEQPRSRTLTVGTYRGRNVLYQFRVPARVLHRGDNQLFVHVVSGSKGKGFLSPGYAFDALEMAYP